MATNDIQTLEEYDLFCDGKLADPYPFFRRLRSEDPVHRSERLNSWILTRYDDVLAASRDRRFSSDRVSVNMSALSEPDQTRFSALGEHVSNWLGFTDPPKHTRMRGLISGVFTPALAENMRDRTQEIVDELIDRVERSARMDLVGDLSYPLPATVICEILGVPAGGQRQFKVWADDIAAFVGATGPYAARAAERAERSRKELTGMFRELTLQRRREPRKDLITALAAREGEEAGLTEQELLGLCVFLFVAGFETTVSLISNGMLSLLQHRGELERLRSDPSLMETAVEEFLRYESPIQVDTRLIAEDLDLRGRSFRKGDAVMMVRAAANRDPAQFPDPDRFDVGRQNNRHVAFGWGIHFCLGAPLARIEAQIAVKTLLDRLPNLRLESDELDWWENMTLRSPRSLPVVF